MNLFFFFQETWDLANQDEKYDVLPEVWKGHNIADFIDPEIMEKLNELEAEEEKLEKIGFYDEKEISDSEELKGIRKVAGRFVCYWLKKRRKNLNFIIFSKKEFEKLVNWVLWSQDSTKEQEEIHRYLAQVKLWLVVDLKRRWNH